MSKGYKCDNCLECYAGDPSYTSDDGRIDFCPNCLRAILVLNKIDPFDFKSNRKSEEEKIT